MSRYERLPEGQLLTPESLGSTTYKKYYASGVYDGRFDPERPTYRREEDLIIDTFNASFSAFRLRNANQSELAQDFHLLDLGCGSGRTIGMVLYIADKLSQKGVGLTFVGIDPEQAGLDIYKERLMEKGFSLHDPVADGTINLSKNNIKFKLVAGDQHKISELDKTFDMSISMFGVLSHIRGVDNRVEALAIINEKTCGFLAITIAGYNGFRDRIKLFDELRKVDDNWAKAIEKGDFRYTIAGANESNYYHAAEIDEARNDAVLAGYEVTKVGVSSILHPSKIPSQKWLSGVDKFASRMATRILPSKHASEISCYIELCGKSTSLVELELNEQEAEIPSPRTIRRGESQPLLATPHRTPL